MLDFLPLQERKHIISEYLARIFIVLMLSVFSATIILVALFLPSYFFSQYKDQTIAGEARFVNPTSAAAYDSAAATIASVNATAAALAPSQNDNALLTNLIREIVSLKNASIVISSLSFSADPGNHVENITLGGTAESRDSLTAFYNALKANGSFTSVVLPVSSLIADAGNPFTITLAYPIH